MTQQIETLINKRALLAAFSSAMINERQSNPKEAANLIKRLKSRIVEGEFDEPPSMVVRVSVDKELLKTTMDEILAPYIEEIERLKRVVDSPAMKKAGEEAGKK
jgi:hypothetical protein